MRIIAALIVIAGAGQAFAADAAFEVASIRPADPDRSMSITHAGDRLSISNYSLAALIEWAYNIRGDRLLGQPGGLDTVRYDVNAETPQRPLAPGELYLMMRTLLAERFRLAVHTETRELTHYEMVVDKGGVKVHPEPLSGPVGQNPFSMTATGHLTGTKVSAEMVAKVLADQTGRFVEDRTGLTGLFDFTLDWTPDTGDISGVAPSIFTAVKQQLGFRLDGRKGPVEVIVIDHVEIKPTEN